MYGVDITVVAAGVELSLVGRLDTHSSAPVRSALHREIEAGWGDLTVHLADLEIWDASGLGVLVGAHRRARGLQRRLVIADMAERERRLVRAARLHRVLVLPPRSGPPAEVDRLLEAYPPA